MHARLSLKPHPPEHLLLFCKPLAQHTSCSVPYAWQYQAFVSHDVPARIPYQIAFPPVGKGFLRIPYQIAFPPVGKGFLRIPYQIAFPPVGKGFLSAAKRSEVLRRTKVELSIFAGAGQYRSVANPLVVAKELQRFKIHVGAARARKLCFYIRTCCAQCNGGPERLALDMLGTLAERLLVERPQNTEPKSTATPRKKKKATRFFVFRRGRARRRMGGFHGRFSIIEAWF
jgi:hypothetical protein